MATLIALADKCEKKLLKRPMTAGEIGARVGYTGRGVAKPLGVLVRSGRARKFPGRKPRYSKVG